MTTTVVITNQGPAAVLVRRLGAPDPVRHEVGETKTYETWVGSPLTIAEVVDPIQPRSSSTEEHEAEMQRSAAIAKEELTLDTGEFVPATQLNAGKFSYSPDVNPSDSFGIPEPSTALADPWEDAFGNPARDLAGE